MKTHWFMQFAAISLGLVVTGVNSGISCYVCDTTKVDNYNPQICDDTFLASRGAKIEMGCAACTKERTLNLGVMFIKRSCDRALRWESSVWSCGQNQEERDYVFGLPGTRCKCLTDLCNSSPRVTQSLLISGLAVIIAKLLL